MRSSAGRERKLVGEGGVELGVFEDGAGEVMVRLVRGVDAVLGK
jgi:hypothetical protein